MTNKTNQLEIFSYDHKIFDSRRQKLFDRCVLISRSKNLKCVIGIPEFGHLDLLGDKTVFIWQFDLLPNIATLAKMDEYLSSTGRQIYIITDNTGPNLNLKNIRIFYKPQMMGVYKPTEELPNIVAPKKLFNCFMQRIDSVRQTWFYFLHHYNLIDNGYVSFLLKQLTKYSTLTGQELFNYIHYNYELDKIPHFESAYQHWRTCVPFTNFDEKHNLPALYRDCKYSLVLETYATEDNNEFRVFNEKAIRVLQIPTLPLLFVQQNSIKLLIELGFQIGHHHSAFDHLPWQQRQQHLLNILVEDSIAYDSNLLYNQAMYNRELVTKFSNQCDQLNFFDEILDQL